nr:NAD(P)H-dependent oxidoreductase subunit E [Angustibacter aerolatus]
MATFYSQYKRHPNGEYTVGVCTNTLCAIMGGDAIFDSLSEHLDVGHDETTDDGKITLERLECNAACDYAPVVMVNWEFFDRQTPSSAREVVDDLRAGAPVVPTRGAGRVCTFKQVSRVLAGFDDGRADEGVGAGDASLVGLRLAKERGWTAPSPAPAARRHPPSRWRPRRSAPRAPRAPTTQPPRGRPATPAAPTRRTRRRSRHDHPHPRPERVLGRRRLVEHGHLRARGRLRRAAHRAADAQGRPHPAWSRTRACAAAAAPGSPPA